MNVNKIENKLFVIFVKLMISPTTSLFENLAKSVKAKNVLKNPFLKLLYQKPSQYKERRLKKTENI